MKDNGKNRNGKISRRLAADNKAQLNAIRVRARPACERASHGMPADVRRQEISWDGYNDLVHNYFPHLVDPRSGKWGKVGQRNKDLHVPETGTACSAHDARV